MPESVEVNGTRYRWPRQPVVVVCIDGGDPAYFRQGLDEGALPNVARYMTGGFAAVLAGMPQPDMYSMELSLFVLEAGIRLLERERPDLMYLSLTDWVQHKYAPEAPEAKRFYRALDECFGRLSAAGAIVALTADHGMNDKSDAAGRPNVIWLQDILDRELGQGDTRVICPITDAFVAHHGALGGFVRVWCRGKAKPRDVIAAIHDIDGLESVLDRDTACRVHELPPDREGDVAVIARADVCVGASERDHDLSGLAGHRLRTHGGVSEASVPFVLSHPLNDTYKLKVATGPLKSYRIFD